MCVLQKWDVWGTGLNCDTQPLYLYFVLLVCNHKWTQSGSSSWSEWSKWSCLLWI